MRELTPPDSHYLNAAAGWRELGNYSEARFELERILNRDHPAVLEERWRIFAAEQQWLPALEIARRLIEVAPDDPSGWIHQSYSLHELKRTQEARDRLVAVAGKFSGISTIPYNLACYACQLGEIEQARDWLARAVKIAGSEAVKKMAASDPDLQPMREEIKRL
ncbi:MAG: tetratricopeptide repeat protein [Verrucomicrobia bacterium]|nr:MAG: tetratricopeptide repeat protein [Verrucomicrobiota bacterium]